MADLTQTITARLVVEHQQWMQGMQQAGQAAQRTARATEQAGRAADQAGQQGAQGAQRQEQAQRRAGAAAQTAAGQLANTVGQMEAAAESADGAAESAAGLGDALGEAGQAGTGALSGLQASIQENEGAINDLASTAMGLGALLAAGPTVALVKYASFDKAMSSVSAATHASAEEMGQLREAAMKAGADTAFSAEEAARGIEELAKAGVSTTDVINGGLNGSLSLAAAGNLDVGKAAEIAASAMTQFKLSGDQIPHLADLLAAGAGKAQGSVEDLGQALDQSGLVASQTGLSIEETTGGLAAFASAGLTGSDAGTSFKTMLQSLTPSSEEAATLMDELGISAYDAQGNFVGLSQFAGSLQNGLKDLSVEQQNAAMKTIFGSDAVRAASVLYKEGASGIQGWIDKVNDSGYAAETAAKMQDNLAGDMEKLGGSLDSVFLKSGSGANDFLRGAVQGVEKFIDAVGNIPSGVLSTGTMIAGLGGGALLAVGGFMRLTTSVSNTIGAWRNLQSSAPRAATALSRVGKAAGIAGAAIAAIEFSKMVNNSTEPAAKSAESYAQALTGIGKASDDVAKSNFQKLFVKEMPSVGQSMGKMINPITQASTLMNGMSGDVKNLGDALNRINPDNPMKHLASFGSTVAGFRNDTTVATETLKGLDDALASMATAGDYSQMKDSLAMMIKSAEEGGRSFENLKPQLGGLFDALSAKATELKVSLNPDEIWAWAQTGEVPAQIQQATDALSKADAAAKGLSQSTAEIKPPPSLQELVDGVTKLGNAFLSARDASRGYEEAVDAAQAALKENGKTLDITTEKGRANQAALDGIGSSALAAAESASGMTAKMQALGAGRDEVIRLGQAMGMSKGEAVSLADSMGLIPSKIYTEFSGNPGDMLGQLQGIKAAMDAVPKGKSITIRESNPEVIDAIKRLGYTVQTLPNGRIKITQTGAEITKKQIADAAKPRKAEIVTNLVDLVRARNGLDSVSKPRTAPVKADPQDVDRTNAVLNAAAKPRKAPVSALPGTDGVSGWMGGITQPRTIRVNVAIASVVGAVQTAAKIALGRAKGGRLPGHAAGYRLPTNGPGTDKVDGILGVSGKGMPVARVDAGEWIINRKTSEQHDGFLQALNAGDPRATAAANLTGLASGGRAGWSQGDAAKQQAKANKATARRRNASARVKAEERDVSDAQKRYDKTPGGKKNKGRKDAAWSRLKAQKAQLKRAEASLRAAEKAEEKAKQATTDARERTGRLQETTFSMSRDMIRGDVREAYTSGNAMSMVDKLFEYSNNKDLAPRQRKATRNLAYKQERQVLALEKRQAAVAKSLERAESKRDELKQVRDGVRSSVSGAFDLKSLAGQKDDWGYNKYAGKSGLLAYGRQMAAGAKKLSGKVKALQKAGMPSGLIQQAIDEWTSSQTFELADAMLSMNAKERSTFKASFKAVDTYGAATGQYLTESMYKGGLNAAQGVVNGLLKQRGSVEKGFYDLAKAGERSFKNALGIRSPSRVMEVAGGHTVDGDVNGVRAGIPRVESAMRDLALAGRDAYGSIASQPIPFGALPASPEVLGHAVKAGGSAYAPVDYDRLAEAMSRVQLRPQVVLDRRTQGAIAQNGKQFADNNR